MKESVKSGRILEILALSGIGAPLFYFAHVIAGRIAWPAYNPLSQPVSDLTAVSAISRPLAGRILYGYDILILLFCAVLLVYFGRIRPINRTSTPG